MRPLTSDEVATQLYDLLNQANLDGSISVQNNIEGVLISLSEQITFQPGTANFTPRATAALDRIIAFVAPMENQIKVVGHTDNTPPADERFKNNWELSLGRALAVIEYMQSKGIPGYRLIAAGRGQYEPLFPNDTPQRRALNSRVEIIIIYKVDQNVINPIPTITP
jgi:chemotaxis protein MotB